MTVREAEGFRLCAMLAVTAIAAFGAACGDDDEDDASSAAADVSVAVDCGRQRRRPRRSAPPSRRPRAWRPRSSPQRDSAAESATEATDTAAEATTAEATDTAAEGPNRGAGRGRRRLRGGRAGQRRGPQDRLHLARRLGPVRQAGLRPHQARGRDRRRRARRSATRRSTRRRPSPARATSRPRASQASSTSRSTRTLARDLQAGPQRADDRHRHRPAALPGRVHGRQQPRRRQHRRRRPSASTPRTRGTASTTRTCRSSRPPPATPTRRAWAARARASRSPARSRTRRSLDGADRTDPAREQFADVADRRCPASTRSSSSRSTTTACSARSPRPRTRRSRDRPLPRRPGRRPDRRTARSPDNPNWIADAAYFPERYGKIAVPVPDPRCQGRDDPGGAVRTARRHHQGQHRGALPGPIAGASRCPLILTWRPDAFRLKARAIRKSFGGVEVLHGVDLDAAGGSVLALLGRERRRQVHARQDHRRRLPARRRRRSSSAATAHAVARRPITARDLGVAHHLPGVPGRARR